MSYHLCALVLFIAGAAGITVGYLLGVMIVSDGEWKH